MAGRGKVCQRDDRSAWRTPAAAPSSSVVWNAPTRPHGCTLAPAPQAGAVQSAPEAFTSPERVAVPGGDCPRTDAVVAGSSPGLVFVCQVSHPLRVDLPGARRFLLGNEILDAPSKVRGDWICHEGRLQGRGGQELAGCVLRGGTRSGSGFRAASGFAGVGRIRLRVAVRGIPIQGGGPIRGEPIWRVRPDVAVQGITRRTPKTVGWLFLHAYG